jgi:hypothetical protein
MEFFGPEDYVLQLEKPCFFIIEGEAGAQSVDTKICPFSFLSLSLSLDISAGKTRAYGSEKIFNLESFFVCVGNSSIVGFGRRRRRKS